MSLLFRFAAQVTRGCRLITVLCEVCKEMRIGCCANLDQVQALQDAGYDYVELPVNTVRPEQPDSEWEPVLKTIDEFAIRPEAWNCLLPGDLLVVGPEVDLYRFERYLRSAFERIEQVGGEVVVFGSGGARTAPQGFPIDEARDQFAEALTVAGRVAGTYGITVAIEPLFCKATNVVNSLTEGAEMVKKVNHPFVKLLADLFHMEEENEPTSVIPALGVEFVHAHTADTERLAPGTGSYPNREFIAALRAAGYDNRLSVECVWKDFDSECVKSLEYLRGLG